jgi:glycosyltransferase involved in cell wall biosynthesis
VETLDIMSLSETILQPTGYAVVSKNLVREWGKMGHNVLHVGWNYHGDAIQEPNIKDDPYGPLKNVTLLKTSEVYNIGAYDLLPFYFKRYTPTVVWSLIDVWYTFAMQGFLPQGMKGFAESTLEHGLPYVNYFPIDGEPFSAKWDECLVKSHTVCAMSKYGKNVIEAYAQRRADAGQIWAMNYDIPYIYHGVDTQQFNPYPEKDKDQIRMQFAGTDDPFVLVCVDRNVVRKDYPRLYQAIKYALEKMTPIERKNFVFVQKCGNPADEHHGHHLPLIEMELGLQGYIKNADIVRHILFGLPTKDLALLYNCSDAVISSSWGEGFGLSTLEAMACGKPVIKPRNSATTELIGENNERGWLTDEATKIWVSHGIKQSIPSYESLGEAILECVRNPDLRAKKGKAGLEFAHQNTWEQKAKEFIDLFKKIQPLEVPK